jgi:hypothetical protein
MLALSGLKVGLYILEVSDLAFGLLATLLSILMFNRSSFVSVTLILGIMLFPHEPVTAKKRHDISSYITRSSVA